MIRRGPVGDGAARAVPANRSRNGSASASPPRPVRNLRRWSGLAMSVLLRAIAECVDLGERDHQLAKVAAVRANRGLELRGAALVLGQLAAAGARAKPLQRVAT